MGRKGPVPGAHENRPSTRTDLERQSAIWMTASGLGRVERLLHDTDRRDRTQATAIRSIWAKFTATRPELWPMSLAGQGRKVSA